MSTILFVFPLLIRDFGLAVSFLLLGARPEGIGAAFSRGTSEYSLSGSRDSRDRLFTFIFSTEKFDFKSVGKTGILEH